MVYQEGQLAEASEVGRVGNWKEVGREGDEECGEAEVRWKPTCALAAGVVAALTCN